jgi:hypothetical protein
VLNDKDIYPITWDVPLSTLTQFRNKETPVSDSVNKESIFYIIKLSNKQNRLKYYTRQPTRLRKGRSCMDYILVMTVFSLSITDVRKFAFERARKKPVEISIQEKWKY